MVVFLNSSFSFPEMFASDNHESWVVFWILHKRAQILVKALPVCVYVSEKFLQSERIQCHVSEYTQRDLHIYRDSFL